MRFPLPFVPKAYHVPSSPWTTLGSGKSEWRPSRGARFWMGEARTEDDSVRQSNDAHEKSLGNILAGRRQGRAREG